MNTYAVCIQDNLEVSLNMYIIKDVEHEMIAVYAAFEQVLDDLCEIGMYNEEEKEECLDMVMDSEDLIELNKKIGGCDFKVAVKKV